ncbi:hypothetical protein QJS10_CPA01g02149 [Acorus calamus]|uniref:Protein kinase domain-containing protein n=1 Tax=Acorus calamus TaxID=4465 RepID=A0AAV9FK36_ACOCL|nr:hypothetical protein QJS10_CPA01g02149 [Acorus calamus]
MAFAGVPRLESLQFPFTNPSTRPSRTRFGLSNPRFGRTRAFSARCSSSASASAPAERDVEDGLGPVTAFKMSDFAIRNHVSVGLAGRADEVIFEATVRNRSSPLYKTRVVLCKFTSTHAQRRGRRAIEVLKRLARRLLMYHSYAMQVHGYVCGGDHSSFTLVHGYHGSYSLRHWLQLSDWLPTLEATLALDEEESVRRVGDDFVGGPAISRQLRLTRVLMRDLLIAVNYLHSHGLAHTQLRLENVHVSPVDRHVKIGILGNAVDFYDNSLMSSTADGSVDRRKLMIAFDMRCVGFIMAKMVLRDLMDPSIFMKFKSFFTKGSYPSCLREFLLPILSSNSPSGNAGLQILDRNWGAGWNLLSLLLATNPSERISCLDALRHPFLCGPRWRVEPSMDIIRWGLGSTAVRIAEEYIYGRHQRKRLAYFIELMEMLNPHTRPKSWFKLLEGRWRLLYCTGRHIGLTLRQPSPRVLIRDAYLTFSSTSDLENSSITSDISFKVMPTPHWPHDKSGIPGALQTTSPSARLTSGRRLYGLEEDSKGWTHHSRLTSDSQELVVVRRMSGKKWKGVANMNKEPPFNLPVVKLEPSEGRSQ